MSLASVLQQSDCQLRKLFIQWCGITGEGAAQLTHNNSLTVLMTSLNPIGDSGTAALGDMLVHNTVLRHLGMWVCGITSEGALQLAAALSGNTTLQKLDIS